MKIRHILILLLCSISCLAGEGMLFRDILPEPDGERVWAAGYDGLYSFDAEGKLLKRYTEADGLASRHLTELLIAKDGSLWIASIEGVMRMHKGNIVTYTKEEGLNDNRVYALAEDTEGVIYVGTHKGVNRFDGNKFEPFDDSHEFARRMVRDIHLSADGTLWFAKENGLSHYFGGGEWEIFQKDALKPGKRSDMGSNNILSVGSYKDGRAILGTKMGLSVQDEGSWKRRLYREHFFDGNGVKGNRIETMAVDAEGLVWVGYGDSKDYDQPLGITYFKADKWHHLTEDEGLPSGRVYRIRVDGKNRKWIATAKGGVCWDKGNIQRFPGE